jgi:hypothetical protein
VFKTGLTFANQGSITVNTKVQEEDSDGGLFSFFSTTSGVVDKKVILIVYQESNETTRVSIENTRGEFDTSKSGADFLDLLYNQIR